MKISKIGKLIKDAWLMVGITVLLLCLLEGSLSLAFFIKGQFSASDLSAAEGRVSADTYADPTWVRDYYEEFRRSFTAQWKPYVYWRRKPFHGNHINIADNGLRLTALAPPKQPASHPPLKIFMFGGSALWGTGARDAFTIPSSLAQELQNKGVAAEVINFGEAGYVSTQEVIALLLQLQRGQIPDLVIFYDGVNDLYSAYQQHVAGLPQNEFNRVKEFNLSQPDQFKQRTGLLLTDVATRLATIRFIQGLLQRAGVGRPATAAANPLPRDPLAPQGAALAQDVLATYRGNIEAVQALSAHYRFKCLFYWQPTIFQKTHLTEYERAQRAEMQPLEQFVHRTYEVIRQSGLAERRESSFYDLSRVFAEVREPVYVDWCHLGESGNELIAQRMASAVLALISTDKLLARSSVKASSGIKAPASK